MKYPDQSSDVLFYFIIFFIHLTFYLFIYSFLYFNNFFLFFSSLDNKDFDEILKEIVFSRTVNHPNIIGYIGAYLLPRDVWLVLEYCVGTAVDLMNMAGRTFTEVEIATILGESLKG